MIINDLDFDKKHIWHPYTSMTNPLPVYPIISARGCELTLSSGDILVDGMSSWWAVIHGYNHPRLNKAIKIQMNKMSHVMFGSITHQPAIELCKKLVNLSPKPLDCVFLADSGSVAIEVAMKMALQFWHAKGESRYRFIAFQKSYHGDTFGAMSVCDPDNSMHNLWNKYLVKNIFAPAPKISFYEKWNEIDIIDFNNLITMYQKDIAAVIIEPIVQGAGGMNIYHPEYLKNVRKLCNQKKILLIADEIATGFGRTGKLFACEYANIAPDILCLGKALTGGVMTLSATLTTRYVAETISNGKAGCFMHGPTFMANPLACAVANENLKLLKSGRWIKQVVRIEKQLKNELSPALNSKYVADVRVLGAIGVVETYPLVNMVALQKFFVSRNVWIRPFNHLIYLMPSYLINKKQLNKLTRAVIESVNISDHFVI